MYFILLPDTTQDTDGLGDTWLIDQHLSESSLKSCICLDVFPVLCEGGSTNAPKLATCKQWLEQIRRIHASAFRSSSSHDKVQFVDEEDDTGTIFGGLLYLVEDRLDALFVLALVLGTCHQGSHVEGEEATE